MRRKGIGLFLSVVLVSGGLAIALPATAGASGTNLLTESFQNSTTANSGWQMPTGSEGVCLTAGSNTSATPVPDCNTSPVANGSGELQLTTNASSQVGTIYNSVALPTANGLDVTWDSYQYDGTSPRGADGISFDLAAVDPNDPVPPATVGPSGGSLGYSTISSGSPPPSGVPFGYLGFGADVFGNFENGNFGSSSCSQSTPAVLQSMGVRGPGDGTTGYCLLSQVNLSGSATLDDESAGTPTGLAVPEEVVINPGASAVTASASGISVPGGDYLFATEPLVSDAAGTVWHSIEGSLPTNPVDVQSSWLNSSGLPKELAFGWASSTGGDNEYHAINLLTVSSLTAAPSLALTNTDSGFLVANTPATVTLTASVPNSSAASESQAVVVTDTFPSKLTPTAASGTNWTCTITGQLVSCSYTGTIPIAAGSALPAISVSVTPNATGSFSNSASVSSTDAAPATALDTGTIGADPQVITFTNSPPPSARPGTTYTVTTTGGGSGNPVTYSVDGSSTSGCTVNASSGLVTLTLPLGSCIIDANQAGGGTYLAATQVQQTVYSRIVNPQIITFTNTPPTSPTVGATYTVTATGGGSGNTVLFSVDPSSTSGCTVNSSSGLVTLVAPAGSCVIDANQAGSSNYAAAAQVRQTVTSLVPAGAPTATISSPASGGNYSVGQSVATTYSCADPDGPGIATCSDGVTSNGSGILRTPSPGAFTYSVTATSKDGQTTTTNIRYRVVPRGTSLVILFPNNSWSLTRLAISQLNGFARTLADEHFHRVAISGFASSTGPSTNNDNLGVQRAHAAWAYLLTRLDQLKDHGVTSSLVGYGATHFRVRPTAAAQNRRAVLTAS